MSVRVKSAAQAAAYRAGRWPKNYEYLVAVNRNFDDVYSGIDANVQRMTRASLGKKKK